MRTTGTESETAPLSYPVMADIHVTLSIRKCVVTHSIRKCVVTHSIRKCVAFETLVLCTKVCIQ